MGSYSEGPNGELLRIVQTHEDELQAELALT
jgi:hypothetical protein